MLYDQLNGYRSGSTELNDQLALYGQLIEPSVLLDNVSVGITRHATATFGVLDYYLHAPGGAVRVNGGGFGEQQIQSLAIPASDQVFFDSVVSRLDSIIDLDFRRVDDASSADVDLYYDADIDIGGYTDTLGLAITTGVGGWELYLNYPAFDGDEAYRRYALIHEFGHSLGLEHPFEDRDGDVWNGSTDPWSSAYPEDTVMAYRSPRNKAWPDFFSTNDLNALIQVWGAEPRIFSNDNDIVDGAAYRDIFIGAGGDDELRGRKGADRVEGGLGNDQLMGGDGPDQLMGGAGDDAIFGGFGHDTIFGGSGNDRIRGGYGGDVFVWSSGLDLIEDFRLTENDRIGLRSGIDYQLHQQGNDLQLISSLGIVTLCNVDVDAFSAVDRVVVF